MGGKVVPIRSDIRTHAMTVAELRQALSSLDGQLEVILRIGMNDGSDLYVVGMNAVSVDAGCTDHDSCILDGNDQIQSRHED